MEIIRVRNTYIDVCRFDLRRCVISFIKRTTNYIFLKNINEREKFGRQRNNWENIVYFEYHKMQIFLQLYTLLSCR